MQSSSVAIEPSEAAWCRPLRRKLVVADPPTSTLTVGVANWGTEIGDTVRGGDGGVDTSSNGGSEATCHEVKTEN
jgi:hypothetical protein